MENLEKKQNRPEFNEEYKEALRSRVDEDTDLVIYENAFDKNSDELRIFLKNVRKNEILLDFSAMKYYLDNADAGSDVITVKTTKALGFVCNLSRRMIGVPYEALRDPKEIFGLLHELGHIEIEEEKNVELFKKYAEVKKSSKNPDVDYRKLSIEEERGAWASAIWQARKIKKELGINLFDLFKNSNEFMGWLRVTGLRTYESELESLSGEKVYTKDKQVQKYLDSIKELKNEVEENYAE